MTFRKLENAGKNYLENRTDFNTLSCNYLVQEAATIIKSSKSNGTINDNWPTILNKLNSALDLIPNNTNALTVRGALSIHREKYADAIQDLKKVYKKSDDAKKYLLTALNYQYEIDSSAEILNFLRRVDPGNQIVVNFDKKKENDVKGIDFERKKLSEGGFEQVKKSLDGRKKVDHNIPSTIKNDDNIMERIKKNKKDWDMSKKLDVKVSKDNLQDILMAINHFEH